MQAQLVRFFEGKQAFLMLGRTNDLAATVFDRNFNGAKLFFIEKTAPDGFSSKKCRIKRTNCTQKAEFVRISFISNIILWNDSFVVQYKYKTGNRSSKKCRTKGLTFPLICRRSVSPAIWQWASWPMCEGKDNHYVLNI